MAFNCTPNMIPSIWGENTTKVGAKRVSNVHSVSSNQFQVLVYVIISLMTCSMSKR